MYKIKSAVTDFEDSDLLNNPLAREEFCKICDENIYLLNWTNSSTTYPPLYWAIIKGKYQAASIFLYKYNADLFVLTELKKNSFHILAQTTQTSHPTQNFTKMTLLFFDYLVHYTKKENKTREEINTMFETLFLAQDSNSYSPLHYAIINRNILFCELLLQNHLGVEEKLLKKLFEIKTGSLKTPMHFALINNEFKIADLFLAHGDTLIGDSFEKSTDNPKKKKKNTILHLAFQEHDCSLCEYLLKKLKKGDINLLNDDNETCLDICVSKNYFSLTRQLLQAGAIVTPKTFYNFIFKNNYMHFQDVHYKFSSQVQVMLIEYYEFQCIAFLLLFYL
jgi:ankyrin repeat protein